jgi:hypothetical protein
MGHVEVTDNIAVRQNRLRYLSVEAFRMNYDFAGSVCKVGIGEFLAEALWRSEFGG